jgi:hypothetical protein
MMGQNLSAFANKTTLDLSNLLYCVNLKDRFGVDKTPKSKEISLDEKNHFSDVACWIETRKKLLKQL